MRYLPLPTKEGGYFRTGSRTPMQWGRGRNLGFSRAKPEKLYLPVDPSEDAPTVAAQDKDPFSLLNTVREILALRAACPDLNADAPFKALYAPDPKMDGSRAFAYKRGSLVCAVNPARTAAELPLGLKKGLQPLFALGGGGTKDGTLWLEPQSFVVLG